MHGLVEISRNPSPGKNMTALPTWLKVLYGGAADITAQTIRQHIEEQPPNELPMVTDVTIDRFSGYFRYSWTVYAKDGQSYINGVKGTGSCEKTTHHPQKQKF
jgi:hypothetical protein